MTIKSNKGEIDQKIVRKVNDPIFGLIGLTEGESRVIDTPLVQRLRYIKQLALTHYVYPTATHNRFSHSLGVFYLTGKISDVLNNNGNNNFDKDVLMNLKMAGLLHDVGHFPFSHALEYAKKSEFSTDGIPFIFEKKHEDLTTFIIKNSYLNELLDGLKYDVDLICSLIEGKDVPNLILNRIINSELDSDRLDYILRDSYYTGVGFGRINFEYLISSFQNIDNKRIVINNKAIRDIEYFIIARFSLYDRVYTHKRISFFNYILANAAYEIIKRYSYPSFSTEEKLLEIIKDESSSEKLFELTDFSLLNKMREIYEEIKNKEEEEYLTLLLKTILFRENTYKIEKIQNFSYTTESALNLRKQSIINSIKELQNKFEKDILIDIPRNEFTKYVSFQLPASDISEEDRKKINEEREKSIWIQTESGPETFYETSISFFKKIKELGLTKYLIYLRKGNEDLINEYEQVKPGIEDIIKSN